MPVRNRTTLQDLDGCDLATVAETADILRCDVRTVRSRIASGVIPATNVVGEWRIPTRWLREAARAGQA